MSHQNQSEAIQARLQKIADNFKPKQPRKFALLMPVKAPIKILLAKKATYEDIRLILAEENIIVSRDTIHRFCRQIIGQKPVRQRKTTTKSSKITPIPSSPSNIKAALQEQRERLPGVWGRRKRGPRITDSKNL